MTFTGKRTGRPDSVRRPRAENPTGPRSGRARGWSRPEGPGGHARGEAGPLGRVQGGRAGTQRGSRGGIQRPGRPPWPTGRGRIGRRGPVTAPAGRSPRPGRPPPAAHLGTQLDELRSTSRWRTGSSARGRGCSLAPGRRESRSPRPPRRPWRWRWTRTRTRRPPRRGGRG